MQRGRICTHVLWIHHPAPRVSLASTPPLPSSSDASAGSTFLALWPLGRVATRAGRCRCRGPFCRLGLGHFGLNTRQQRPRSENHATHLWGRRRTGDATSVSEQARTLQTTTHGGGLAFSSFAASCVPITRVMVSMYTWVNVSSKSVSHLPSSRRVCRRRTGTPRAGPAPRQCARALAGTRV